MTAVEELLSTGLADAGSGWSIGTFGAVAEFRRDADEPADRSELGGWLQYVTKRGGIGLRLQQYALPIAYETLASDGETWGQAVALCLPFPSKSSFGVVLSKGTDDQPLQRLPNTELLFDLGIGSGHVSLCVRTADSLLIDALRSVEGKSLFAPEGATARTALLQISPPRIALSPLGRIEVYARIPAPDERSPAGPHTHLMPKLMTSGRTHSANAPIPAGQQIVLSLHPPSPWRDALGTRTAFNASADDAFQSLLSRFGLIEDRSVRTATQTAVLRGKDPSAYPWPATRRARIQARITLRRLAHELGAERLAPWRALFDRSGLPDEAAAEDGDGVS